MPWLWSNLLAITKFSVDDVFMYTVYSVFALRAVLYGYHNYTRVNGFMVKLFMKDMHLNKGSYWFIGGYSMITQTYQVALYMVFFLEGNVWFWAWF